MVVTFLEKKSLVTLANAVLQMGPNTSGPFNPHPHIPTPEINHFPTSFTFLKRNLFEEHNLSMTALVLPPVADIADQAQAARDILSDLGSTLSDKNPEVAKL